MKYEQSTGKLSRIKSGDGGDALCHMGSAWSLPDASWALFFLGGFYLAPQWRWALPGLIALAVVIDLIAIGHLGVSSYCFTAAYVFNAPAYALLWLGGRWLRTHLRDEAADAVRLTLSLCVSVSACYLITNGSFYWLGGRVSETSLAGWLRNLADWYLAYLGNALIYVAIAVTAHLSAVRRTRVARIG